jgi:phage baseplate assembly protein W
MAQKFIGVTLPVRLGQTGMFEQSVDVIQQVRSNFKNLILTKKGERVMEPELGCDLWRVLFDPMNDDTLEAARLSVVNAVDRWLPFIELVSFKITKTDDENILNITCLYRFKSNPNVVDQVTISTEQLGLPSVTLEAEPTTQSEIDAVNNKIREARRIRRI